jgi:hypothetical protein
MRILLLLIAAFVLVSCSDDPAPTSNNDPDLTDTTSGRDTSFAVLSVVQDSLYWSEPMAINMKGLAGRKNIRVFIHTREIEFFSIVGDQIQFIVPENSVAGLIRVYSDTLLASGSVRVTILPMLPPGADGNVTDFSPKQGRVGDKIVITGSGLPLRTRDVRVRVVNTFLPIDSVNSTTIYTHVIPGLQTGWLTVSILNRHFPLGEFTPLQ